MFLHLFAPVQSEKADEQDVVRIEETGQKLSESLWYTKQTIGNGLCGFMLPPLLFCWVVGAAQCSGVHGVCEYPLSSCLNSHLPQIPIFFLFAACGTIGLLHAIFNNTDKVVLGECMCVFFVVSVLYMCVVLGLRAVFSSA